MGQSLKHRVIEAGFRGISASRADRWLAPFAQGRGVILTFHHVRPATADPFQPNALLSITPDHLDRTLALVRALGFDIVPLDEVPARLADGGGRRFAALTFDDGYRDNAVHALPVLRRHGAPWTMFVTTDYASGGGRLWWTELEEVVRRVDALPIGPLGDPHILPARTPDEKNAAFATAYALLRAGPEPALRETIAGWCDAAGVSSAALVRDLCLGWDGIAELASDPLLTIGAHTLSHPMLAKHDEGQAWLEIEGSKVALEDRLGRPVRHFAFPVGDPTSAGPREFRLAAEAGFDTAVTTRPGHLFAEHAATPTALPRVSVNGLYQTEDAMRALLSGVPFLVWNRGRRVNVA